MSDSSPSQSEGEKRRELQLNIESDEKLRYLIDPDGEIKPTEKATEDDDG